VSQSQALSAEPNKPRNAAFRFTLPVEGTLSVSPERSGR
jgi:hypothetical protein